MPVPKRPPNEDATLLNFLEGALQSGRAHVSIFAGKEQKFWITFRLKIPDADPSQLIFSGDSLRAAVREAMREISKGAA